MRLTVLLHAGRKSPFNYYTRYIERMRDERYTRIIYDPARGRQVKNTQKFVYGEDRPYTETFHQDNLQKKNKRRVYIEPLERWNMFKGDRVEIQVGQDKGKHGIIFKTVKERNWVFVEGLNCEHKMEQSFPGVPPQCNKEEQPLLITTDVLLVDPTDQEGTEMEWRYDEEGEEVRVSLRTGAIIPIPFGAQAIDDFIDPTNYAENRTRDTREDDVKKVTFKPKLCSFEEDINESMGIKDDRKPAKTYWY